MSIGSLFLVVALAAFRVDAHRSLPAGVTCSSQFYSPETALAIPYPKVSWASYRIFTCDEPVFWLEAQADAGQPLKFTALVPVLDRFEGVRISVAFISRSLPALADDAVVPNQVRDYIDETGYGAVLFDSPQDQRTCNHLTSEPMLQESEVKDGRCDFYERFGESNSWVLLDETLEAVEAGLYKIAVFVEGDTTAKASFACCEFDEDFVTDYPIPEADCPYCGTSPEENPAWASHFYEQKSMEPYAGFPPAMCCRSPVSVVLKPKQDQCPPTADPDLETQPDSCTLGCNAAGECHSHNAFGECTHMLDWNLEPKFGDAPVSKVTIFKGDKITFVSESPSHNLFEITDEAQFEQCDFSDATAIANVEEVSVGHTIEFYTVGTFHFACGIGCTDFPTERQSCHCTIGQTLTVEVKDTSEGLRCHDHAQFSNDVPELSCADAEIMMYAIDNADLGAMDDNECAEFCIPSMVQQFMSSIAEEGSCADAGYIGSATRKTVSIPGSPQDLDVRVVMRNETTCHCHPYEEIACPEDEQAGDTLYDEHIGEIEEYCAGILNETEADCPYKCSQPMNVLHLHYLECESREIDPTYLAVNATAKCHIGAPAPAGVECPTISQRQEGNGMVLTFMPASDATRIVGNFVGLLVLSLIVL